MSKERHGRDGTRRQEEETEATEIRRSQERHVREKRRKRRKGTEQQLPDFRLGRVLAPRQPQARSLQSCRYGDTLMTSVAFDC